MYMNGIKMQLEASNVWKQLTQSKNLQAQSLPYTVMILGDTNTGKTSLLKLIKNSFDLDTKPTQLLQYSFIRKSALIHCYDISLFTLIPFVETVIFTTQKTLKTLPFFIINIDLTNFKHLLQSIDMYKKAINSLTLNDDCQKERWNILLVGTKYDLFEKYPLDTKKWVGRALRYAAIKQKCSLIYSSTKNTQLGLELRTLFYDEIFQKQSTGTVCKDYTKPLLIHRGCDEIEELGLPSAESLIPEEIIKRQLTEVAEKLNEIKTTR